MYSELKMLFWRKQRIIYWLILTYFVKKSIYLECYCYLGYREQMFINKYQDYSELIFKMFNNSYIVYTNQPEWFWPLSTHWAEKMDAPLIISPSGRYHYFPNFLDEELKCKELNCFSKVYCYYIGLESLMQSSTSSNWNNYSFQKIWFYYTSQSGIWCSVPVR